MRFSPTFLAIACIVLLWVSSFAPHVGQNIVRRQQEIHKDIANAHFERISRRAVTSLREEKREGDLIFYSMRVGESDEVRVLQDPALRPLGRVPLQPTITAKGDVIMARVKGCPEPPCENTGTKEWRAASRNGRQQVCHWQIVLVDEHDEAAAEELKYQALVQAKHPGTRNSRDRLKAICAQINQIADSKRQEARRMARG